MTTAPRLDQSGQGQATEGVVADPVTVNGFDILDKVAALPVSTWRYHWEPDDVRHLGPMAQDWQATFGLSADGRSIPGVDATGVLLVAIQALHRQVRQLQTEVARLRDGSARDS
ncbi:tail fiber domain-containing protein [Streptomyces sp. NPDC058671]|uniref:tail fiber domain-containing protein n=1 Tax=Streptomyces sp. NPDC058671 TaxID=3346590 RepID=UPI0036487628